MSRWWKLAGPLKHTSRLLAMMLRPVGARPGRVGERSGGVNTKGYRLGNLAPAFARYLND
jgi:hypothetical protein